MALTSLLFVPRCWTSLRAVRRNRRDFIALELWHPNKTMSNTIMAFAVGAVVIAFLRSDLAPPMLINALSFTALYFFLFLSLLLLYPDFVQRFYNIPGLLGIYVLGVPLEELLFAASGGAIGSVT